MSGPPRRSAGSANGSRAAGGRATRSRKPVRDRRRAGRVRALRVALVVVVVALGSMSLGPLQQYTAAADRVDALEGTRDALREQVDRLEDRKAVLSDPEELELIARTELGLVKPGEVPYIVVQPDGGASEQVRPEPPAAPEPDGGPWYRRLGRAIAGLFETTG